MAKDTGVSPFQNSWFLGRVSFVQAVPQYAPPASGSHRLARRVGAALVEIEYGGACHVAVDETRDLTVLVHGDLYDPFGPNPAELVLRLYAADQIGTWIRLNGSMVVLVLDGRTRRFMVVTDRVNSRKVFASQDPVGWWLSSSLNIHPTQGLTIDPAGVGSLLTNRVMHGDLTPFREVKKLSRASVHTFAPDGFQSREYWQYEFTGENRNVPRAELRDQLRELLRDGVRRRARTADGRLFISLSGGKDSKSIAGFLAETVGPERLSAFTYHHGPRHGGVDAPAAEEAAKFLGIEHRTIELFDGDLMRVIDTNSVRGQGMKVAKETDFWATVGPLMRADPTNALFVGDSPFHFKERRSDGQKEDLLALVNVYPPAGIEWFLARLSGEKAAAIRDGWHDSWSDLQGRVPHYEDWRDAQSYLYLDQRIPNFLMPWRESFQMPYVRVFNPYLDNDVLDFVRTLPGDLRVRKVLFTEAVASAFPELFSLPVTDGGFGLPTFADEIRDGFPEIKTALQSRPCRLDDLVPPNAIEDLIQSRDATIATRVDKLRAIGKQVPKRFGAARKAVRTYKKQKQAMMHHVPWTELVFQLLALRGFLTRDRRPARGHGLAQNHDPERPIATDGGNYDPTTA